MGLDMMLYGSKSKWRGDEREDGFRVTEHVLKLAYWRKHPDLHGYIVETFANGTDECQRIDLEPDDLRKILMAVQEDRLPHTEGFFFGQSDSADEQDTVAKLTAAIQWVEAELDGEWRQVYYRASW